MNFTCDFSHVKFVWFFSNMLITYPVFQNALKMYPVGYALVNVIQIQIFVYLAVMKAQIM